MLTSGQHCHGQKDGHDQERQTRDGPLPQDAVRPLLRHAAGGGSARHNPARDQHIPSGMRGSR